MRVIEFPSIPYETAINGGVNHGATIDLSGTPFQGRCQQFTINLRSREGIALHFTVRMGQMGENVVVLNNERHSRWQAEQRIPNPFRNGLKFKLAFVNTSNDFTIYHNGSPLTRFHHRESPHNITGLEISGDIMVETLVLDKFTGDYNTSKVSYQADVLSVSLSQTHISSSPPFPAGTVYRETGASSTYPYQHPSVQHPPAPTYDPYRQPNTQQSQPSSNYDPYRQSNPQNGPPASTYDPYRQTNTSYAPASQPTYDPYRNQGTQQHYPDSYDRYPSQNTYPSSTGYRSQSPTRVYVQEQSQGPMVIEHQYPNTTTTIRTEPQQSTVYLQQQQATSVTVRSEAPQTVYYEQEAPPPIYVHRQQQVPQVVVREEVPPPIYVRQQRPPSPVIIERQVPTTVVYTQPQPPTTVVVNTQKPCKTALVAEGVHNIVDIIADTIHNSKKRCN